jgi:prepilin-type N-terminal cleavage/methylation domain-containing protein
VTPIPDHRAGSRAGGFTLVELLTVAALLGVIATLAASGVARASARVREGQCLDNLRQVAVATELYLKETARRPRSLSRLAARSNPLARGSRILCPGDPVLRIRNPARPGGTNDLCGWGNRANGSQQPIWSMQQRDPDGLSFDQEMRETAETLEFSYLHAFSWRRPAWERLAAGGGAAGLAVCQLHGIGLQKETQGTASHLDFEGKTLRAQRDGAVVNRRILRTDPSSMPMGVSTVPVEDYPWDFYLDLPPAPARL